MLVHVGSDRHGLLSGIMADEGMSARLIRHSGIADSALAALYESALCLVVPSFYEGFCLPLVEAQRYGCPVLFADSPGTGETGGMGGVSFRPDDLAELAECLGRIVASAPLRATMRTSGHRNASPGNAPPASMSRCSTLSPGYAPPAEDQRSRILPGSSAPRSRSRKASPLPRNRPARSIHGSGYSVRVTFIPTLFVMRRSAVPSRSVPLRYR